MDYYFVYCLTSIVPIVKRKSLGKSDWLKRVRSIRFLLYQMVEFNILNAAAVA